jgi:hypothetical protein
MKAGDHQFDALLEVGGACWPTFGHEPGGWRSKLIVL